MVTVIRKNTRGFDQGYELLWQFFRREGHAAVPEDHVEGSFALGAWAAEQRRRRSAGGLSPVEEVKLSTLKGWTWDLLSA